MFYDGTCGLCHRTVAFLLRHDHEGRLRFATLQGATAAALLPEHARDAGTGGTVVLFEPEDGGRLSLRSRAVLRALARVGGVWRAAGWLAALPGATSCLDPIYAVVARNRIRWFGRRDACPVPEPSLRPRFLD